MVYIFYRSEKRKVEIRGMKFDKEFSALVQVQMDLSLNIIPQIFTYQELSRRIWIYCSHLYYDLNRNRPRFSGKYILIAVTIG